MKAKWAALYKRQGTSIPPPYWRVLLHQIEGFLRELDDLLPRETHLHRVGGGFEAVEGFGERPQHLAVT